MDHQELLRLAGAAYRPKDIEHIGALVKGGATDLLERVKNNDIALRDAVGVMKRRSRKEQDTI